MTKRKEKDETKEYLPWHGFLRVGEVHKLTKRTKLGCFPTVGDIFFNFFDVASLASIPKGN